MIPDEESVEVYILKDNSYALSKGYEKVGTLESPLLKDLKVELSKVFS